MKNKKTLRKVLAVILTLVLTASVFSTTAFAATKSTVKSYGTYVYLGDSIAAGYLQPGYKGMKKTMLTWPVVKTSYPAIVSKAVKAKYTYNLAKSGYRSQDLRRVLDPSYKGDALCWKVLPSNTTTKKVDEAALKKLSAGYIKTIKKANLITLEIGANDSTQPQKYARQMLLSGEVNSPESAQYFNQLNAIEATCISSFIDNFNAIVKEIITLNPKAKLVVVGFYNAFDDYTLDVGSASIQYGKILTHLIDIANYYLEYQCPYRSKYVFADTQGIQTCRSYKHPSTYVNDSHPTATGHKQIADRIFKVLPAKTK